jgi:hypothetical protein
LFMSQKRGTRPVPEHHQQGQPAMHALAPWEFSQSSSEIESRRSAGRRPPPSLFGERWRGVPGGPSVTAVQAWSPGRRQGIRCC